jgi:hypothetical protein
MKISPHPKIEPGLTLMSGVVRLSPRLSVESPLERTSKCRRLSSAGPHYSLCPCLPHPLHHFPLEPHCLASQQARPAEQSPHLGTFLGTTTPHLPPPHNSISPPLLPFISPTPHSHPHMDLVWIL